MDIQIIKNQFQSKLSTYENLGKNVIESIRILLEEANIKVLSLYFRVKEVDSFLEKIERKTYENPLEEIEDICGVRIICYYQKDINKITEIIKREFNIHEFQNKEDKLGYDQFGYRSHHVIASVRKDWEKTPNFKGLASLKCEIQVRTILMHAWAEIEHNLAYKNEAQTPEQFRRKLHRISAKLEEADEQFEDLKKESEEYQKALKLKIIKNLDNDTKLNLDSLQAFMDTNFPKRKKNIDQTGSLLNQMIEYGITLQDLSEGWKKIKPLFKELEAENFSGSNLSGWVQVGIARIVLDLTHERFVERFKTPVNRNRIMRLKAKYSN